MYSSYPLDTPPPPSQFRRPWSPDPYDPLPSTSSQMRTHRAQNQRREPSEVSVEALDLADYARTLNMRSAEHKDTSYPFGIPAYRVADLYPPSPVPEGFRPLATRDTLSPPSLSAGSSAPSRVPTSSTSRAPLRRPFSLPPSSYPHYPPDLHSRPSQSSRGHTNPSLPSGAPPSEIDISQFPAFARGWYPQEPQRSNEHSRDPLIPSQPNVFDPSFPTETFRPAPYSLPHLGYYSPPPSYPSHTSRSSRDYLPWSGDPPETNGPLDSDVKEERMRMLEREFGAKTRGKGADEGEHVVGSVDGKGHLITEGPKKRLAVRWFQILLALLAGGASIYAGVAIKLSSPAPPAGKVPLYILYAISMISFLLTSYLFLIRPCCGGRRGKKNTPFTQGPGGMMVLPVQSFPGGKKKGDKKKGGPASGDVQVNLIVDPGMFGQSRREDEEDDDDGSEFDAVPGSYTTSSSGRKRRNGAPRRRSVFDGLALEAQWTEARKWLKWGMVVDLLSMVLWGVEFVLIMLGKRCPPGHFDGWCDAYNLSTAAACLLVFAFGLSVYFDVKDLHSSQTSPRTRT